MKKIIILLIFVIATFFYFMFNKQISDSTKSIAIITTLSHPALDEARAGFIKQINKIAEGEFNFKYFNAEGSMQQANQIARQIAGNKNIVGIFAIGTLAAQSIAKAEKERPIVIAAVSDPHIIVDDKSTNVFGLTDTINPKYQIESILKLLPKTKSISLLYSVNEVNSSSMVKNLEKIALQKKLRVSLVGVLEPQQIFMASIDACKKSDLILIPLDNQLVASMPAVIKATKDLSCPVITSNESPIHQGAALSFGVNYKVSGQRAADIFYGVIKNKKPQQKFINPQSIDIFINEQIFKHKSISINHEAKLDLIEVQGKQ